MEMDGFMAVSSIMIIVATAITLGLILMTPLAIILSGIMFLLYSLADWYETNFFPHELNKKPIRPLGTALSKSAIRNTRGGLRQGS